MTCRRYVDHFNPRSSCEERLGPCEPTPRTSSNFNPRSSCEERLWVKRLLFLASHFNPRSSCEERLVLADFLLPKVVISIHAPHARSDMAVKLMHDYYSDISIHAPHARSDQRPGGLCLRPIHISIHAPHARSDHDQGVRELWWTISIHAPHARSDPSQSSHISDKKFQSTLLMRGATSSTSSCASAWNFNPRSSCEERHDTAEATADAGISIHAPHARSDVSGQMSQSTFSIFQSTLLMRGATAVPASMAFSSCNFNPRSSCEERPGRRATTRHFSTFQSTLLMRGATYQENIRLIHREFQSTLLMRGATR